MLVPNRLEHRQTGSSMSNIPRKPVLQEYYSKKTSYVLHRLPFTFALRVLVACDQKILFCKKLRAYSYHFKSNDTYIHLIMWYILYLSFKCMSTWLKVDGDFKMFYLFQITISCFEVGQKWELSGVRSVCVGKIHL